MTPPVHAKRPNRRPARPGCPLAARVLACVAIGWIAALVPAPAHAEIAIDIEGVDAELRRNVLAFLSLERYKERDDLDEALMERLQDRAVREARNALRPFGYYEPKVETQVTRSSGRNWRARIRIEPGLPVIMEDVVVQVLGPGAENPSLHAIVANPPLRPGGPLNHAAYETIKNDLTRTAATLGYLEAKLLKNELVVNPPARVASATLTLETGPRYRFGATTIEQDIINASLLRRFVRYEQDDPYDATQLLRTQFALDDSQYFSTVEVLPGEPDREEHVVPVSIRAEPNRRDRYSVGFGYGTDTELRGTLTWENRRINTRGHRFRAELRAAQIEQTVEARYVIPIGDPALEKLSLEFSYDRRDLGDLDTRTTDFEPSITQIRGLWQRVLFTSFRRTTTIVPGTLTTPGSTDIANLLIPGISYASVPRGYLGEALFSRALYAELRGSSTALGAPDNYLQLRIEGERVIDLGARWHIFLRGQIGASLISDTGNLPGTERFFAGGDRSVRGFGYNDLGPRDANGINVGGKHQIAGAIELIRDLPRNFGAAVFADVGNAFDRFGDPLQYAVGIGVRLRLPVVTLGLDIAQPLTNPLCRAANPDPRCGIQPGFDDRDGPRLHLNFSPKL
ncbi:MAG: BamA/TamA family outer membrane protein [Steroidobacteraceae bacterium]|nr:BamA/TamA family outer membrane protein [Nevskiaceae bacterium]MCP5470802.1 BamA/TamA family outer membrane protein [Nevskiaceae bacterium]